MALAGFVLTTHITEADAVTVVEDWSKHRKAKPVRRLLPISEKWFDTLPTDAFPAALAAQYPRIINCIAVQWNDVRWCLAYFEELLVDRRGGRRGFPADVLRDLQSLHALWHGGHSVRTGVGRINDVLKSVKPPEAPDEVMADEHLYAAWRYNSLSRDEMAAFEERHFTVAEILAAFRNEWRDSAEAFISAEIRAIATSAGLLPPASK